MRIQEVREAGQKGQDLSKDVAPHNIDTWPDSRETALAHQPRGCTDPVRRGRRPFGQRSVAMVRPQEAGPGVALPRVS